MTGRKRHFSHKAYVKIIYVSAAFSRKCLSANCSGQSLGRGHPPAQGPLAGSTGAAPAAPAQEGAGGSSRAGQGLQHSRLLHSSVPAGASCQTASVPGVRNWDEIPRRLKRFIN